MAASGNKTKAEPASVEDFIAAVTDERQRDEAKALCAMLERLSGQPATMWGPSIIGFDRYHYRYESGREGDMCRIGFSPRKGQTVLYIVDGFPGHADIMARLGKVKTGKSCLYVKRLTDIDMSALEDLCVASLAVMKERYPNRS